MLKLNRRKFLSGSALSFAGATTMLNQLGFQKAWAADVSGYKALVCVFLEGGMDNSDTVIPTNQPSYDKLVSVRQELMEKHYKIEKSDSSRNINNLLPLNIRNGSDFGKRTFGLPPNMAGIQDMFNKGEAAIVGNVGTLIEPTNRQKFEQKSVNLPPHLFSHNDQRSIWVSLSTEGTTTGWGGQFADKALASDPNADPVYAAITMEQNNVFLAGNQARQFRASSEGDDGLKIVTKRNILGKESGMNDLRDNIDAYFQNSNFGHDHIFERDVINASANGIAKTKRFKDRIASFNSGIMTSFPGGILGPQLSDVAKTIELRNVLADTPINRQVFFVNLDGFDTHNEQASTLPDLQGELNDSLVAFRAAMQELGVWEDVTVFTASDFGRTTAGNQDGTDHGWGNHHFVMGGSVRGQTVYGELPEFNLESDVYTEKRGCLIPSTAVEQYAATLGKWFGLNPEELNDVFPLLKNFSTSDMGFMK